MIVNSKNIIIVPGYGLAVGKAQYPIAEIAKILKDNEVNIRSAMLIICFRNRYCICLSLIFVDEYF
jgi:NAD/NADP transhydrogenase beta subunit